MNKYKEAINYLWKSYDENKIYGIASRGYIEMLQELVDKETPKKPDYEGDGYSDGELVYDTWICPNCGKSYEVDYEEYKRCPHFGQMIDWSEKYEP